MLNAKKYQLTQICFVCVSLSLSESQKSKFLSYCDNDSKVLMEQHRKPSINDKRIMILEI